MVEEIKKQKRPILIGIIALLMLLGGIFEVFTAFPAFMLFGLYGVLMMISGIVAIVIAFGLDKMKMWALYGVVALTALQIILSLITMSISAGVVFSVLITLYLWSNRKLFSK